MLYTLLNSAYLLDIHVLREEVWFTVGNPF